MLGPGVGVGIFLSHNILKIPDVATVTYTSVITS